MSSTPTPSDPESVFASWAEQAERVGVDGAPSFDAVVAEHPVHADTLRRMYADWMHFAPLLARVVPGLMASEVGLGALPLPSGTDESAQPVTPELLDRLGIQVPDSGRYRFRGVLGQGGGGVVLRVWDQKLQRPLAMKVVLGPSELRAGQPRAGQETPPVDATLLTRFVDEARIASQLDHPSIVPVHELGTDSTGRAYFTMRLVRGRDLHRILEARREGDAEWNEPRLLGILAKACEAVAYAHERGVVHRDLKPSNIMVGRHGEVHVMDWGLARVLSVAAAQAAAAAGSAPRQAAPMPSAVRTVRSAERDTTPGSPLLTGAGAALGTPAYMAPEQARGEHARVDARADVYAIGSILYEVLGGTPPFVPLGAKVDAGLIYLRLLEGPPRPLRELAPRTPEQLLAITERAMAREPGDRYPDVRALENDLRAYLERRVVKAYETGVWAETRQWVRRNRALAGAFATIAVVATVGAIAFAVVARTASANAVGERESRTKAEAALEEALWQQYVANIRAANLARSERDGLAMRQHLDAAPEKFRGWEWGYLDAQSDNSMFTFDAGSPIRAAIFDPSGTRLLTSHEDGKARTWDTVLGVHLQTLEDAREPMAWSHDSALFVTTSEGGGVTFWSTSAASPKCRIELAVKDPTAVAFARNRNESTILDASQLATVVDYGDGVVVRTLSPDTTLGAVSWAALSADGESITRAYEGGLVDHQSSATGATVWRRPLDGIDSDQPQPGSQEWLLCENQDRITLAERATGLVVHEIPHYPGASYSLNSDGDVLLQESTSYAIGSKHQSISAWSVPRRRTICQIELQSYSTYEVHLGPSGKAIIARPAYDSPWPLCWLLQNASRIDREPDRPQPLALTGLQSIVQGVAIAPMTDSVAGWDYSGQIRIWHPRLQPSSPLRLRSLAVGARGMRDIATANASLWLLDGITKEPVAELPQQQQRITRGFVFNQDKHALLISASGEAFALDTISPSLPKSISPITKRWEHMAFNSASKILTLIAVDGTVLQWNSETITSSETRFEVDYVLALNHIGDRAIVVRGDQVQLVEVPGANLIASMPEPFGADDASAFDNPSLLDSWTPSGSWDCRFRLSPCGIRVAWIPDNGIAEEPSKISLFDVQSGNQRSLLSPRGLAQVVWFSADGLRLAGSAVDAVLRIWDTRTCAELLTERLTDGRGWNALEGFAPDGQLLETWVQSPVDLRVRDTRRIAQRATSHRTLASLRSDAEQWVNRTLGAGNSLGSLFEIAERTIDSAEMRHAIANCITRISNKFDSRMLLREALDRNFHLESTIEFLRSLTTINPQVRSDAIAIALSQVDQPLEIEERTASLILHATGTTEQYKKACTALAIAARLEPESRSIDELLAIGLYRISDFDSARQILSQITQESGEFDPDSFAAILDIMLMHQEGDESRALARFEAVSEAFRENPGWFEESLMLELFEESAVLLGRALPDLLKER